jgi:hypothetical protein
LSSFSTTAKLIFLKKVGDGNIFIHRMLPDHFAARGLM